MLGLCLNRAESPREFGLCQEMPSRPLRENIEELLKGLKGVGDAERGREVREKRDEGCSTASRRHLHRLRAFLPVPAREYTLFE